MTKWEYQAVHSRFGIGESVDTLGAWIDSLNDLGEEGWEMIGDVNLAGFIYPDDPDRNANVNVLLAKRQKH
jgi:hypothetical protein